MSDIQRWASADVVKSFYFKDGSGPWVLAADAEAHEAAAVAAARAEGAEKQQAKDYVSLWARLMLEDRKYRAALARAAIAIRQRLTDDDVFRLTGKHVRLHEWETVKPVPDAYEQGQRDERAKWVARAEEFDRDDDKVARDVIQFVLAVIDAAPQDGGR